MNTNECIFKHSRKLVRLKLNKEDGRNAQKITAAYGKRRESLSYRSCAEPIFIVCVWACVATRFVDIADRVTDINDKRQNLTSSQNKLNKGYSHQQNPHFALIKGLYELCHPFSPMPAAPSSGRQTYLPVYRVRKWDQDHRLKRP